MGFRKAMLKTNPGCKFCLSLPKFDSEFAPEKLPPPNRKPDRSDRLPSSIFQGRVVKLRGGNGFLCAKNLAKIFGLSCLVPNIPLLGGWDPSRCKWLITMVIVSPLTGVVPLPNGLFYGL